MARLLVVALLAGLFLPACGDGETPDRREGAEESCSFSDLYEESVPFELFNVPDDCVLRHFPFESSPEVFRTAASFAETFECPVDALDDVDFSSNQIVATVFRSNPLSQVEGVYVDGESIRVQMVSQRYCGGFPPDDDLHLILIPAGEGEVYQDACTYGVCEGPERP